MNASNSTGPYAGRRADRSPDRSRGGRLRRAAAILTCLAFCLAAPIVATAQQAGAGGARMHDLAWGHPNPAEVSRFVLLVSPTGSANDARQVDLGKPAGTPLAQMTVYSAIVSFEPDEFVAVSAVGFDGQVSAPSAWTGMPATKPGQPLVVGY